MSWLQEVQQATIDGVPFFVEGTEGSYGRRAVVHEYPLRDKPFVEDLGRKARSFTVEGLVLGPTYMQARDALTDALEQPGARRLVHPYLGERTVTVLEFKVKETTAEGGMARFSITCVEAGELTYPSAQLDTAQQVDLSADLAMDASLEDFSESFDIGGFPEFVTEAAGFRLGDALDAIQSLSGSLPALPDLASAFGPLIAGVRSGLASLMQGPRALGSALTGLVSGLAGLFELPSTGLGLLRKLFDFGDDADPVPTSTPGTPSTPSTPSRIQQAANQAAVSALVQRAAVIEAARNASQIEFTGYVEAVTVREQLADQLDVLAETAGNDQVYQALVTLRSAVIRDITVRGADLARTTTVTPLVTQPALALAYALYEDASRDQEIIARNKVRHPGFVPGGRPLEVLADA